MLRGALAQLWVGKPEELATDVGPVIDDEAFVGISRHVERLKREATLIAESPIHDSLPRQIRPVAFELAAIQQLGAEIFGPVLHVVRWKGEPDAVIAQINALGYGLTLGVQTRIDSRAQRLASLARVGNVYVNRNIIGAVVGVQPFGGEGLSGTGPKAGGPHYLKRFVAEPAAPKGAAITGGSAACPALPSANGGTANDIALPGPTGESNTLRHHPRGLIAVLGGGAPGLTAVRTALRAGNAVAWVVAAAEEAEARNALPIAALTLVPEAALDALIAHPALAGVALAHADAPLARRLQGLLSARSGAILPLILSAADPSQAYRFSAEQTLTINTAAAGGNAALLAGQH